MPKIITKCLFLLFIFLTHFFQEIKAQRQWRTYQLNTNENINSLYFPSPLIGFAVAGPYVIEITNRGKEWSFNKIDKAETLNDIFFNEFAEGWAVGRSLNGNGLCLRGRASRPFWEDVECPGFENVEAVQAFRDFVIMVTRSGAAKDSINFFQKDSSKICTSLDRGEKWKCSDTFKNISLFDISFISPAEGWAVGAVSGEYDCTLPNSCPFGTSYVGGVVYHTADSGNSWIPQNYQYSKDTPSHTSDRFYMYLNSIEMVSANHGFAVGGFGVDMESGDEGLFAVYPNDSININWLSTEYPQGSYGQFRAISYPPEFKEKPVNENLSIFGWIVGDNGNIWKVDSFEKSLEDFSVEKGDFLSVYSLQGYQAWAAGKNGIIAYYGPSDGVLDSIQTHGITGNSSVERTKQNIISWKIRENSGIQFKIDLGKESLISLSLYDVTGKRTAVVENIKGQKGPNYINTNKKLPQGLYTLVFNEFNGSTKKIFRSKLLVM